MKEYFINNKRKILIIGSVLLIFLVFITTLSGYSKSKNDYTRAKKREYINLGEIVTLKPKGTIYIDDNKNTSIRFITFIDNRCSSGNSCVWEGQIEYTFEYKNNNTTEKFIIGSVRNQAFTIDEYTIYYIEGNTEEIKIMVGAKG